MGCLKLTYSQQDTPLKVVYRKTEPQQKGVQRFLSVDPMASEREWVSPYNFCQNNPINRTDPTGALDTDYGLKSNGEVVQISPTNNEPDRLFALNDDNTVKKDVAPITINDPNILPVLALNLGSSHLYHFKDKNDQMEYNKVQRDLYPNIRLTRSKNKDDMFNLFTFTSKNSSVEWELALFNIKGNDCYVLGSSQNKGSALRFDLLYPGLDFKNLKFDIHSHPYGSLYGASGYPNGVTSDLYMLKQAPNVPHYIYDVTTSSVIQYTLMRNDINKGKVNNYKDFFKLNGVK